jgi:hypothetical protein
MQGFRAWCARATARWLVAASGACCLWRSRRQLDAAAATAVATNVPMTQAIVNAAMALRQSRIMAGLCKLMVTTDTTHGGARWIGEGALKCARGCSGSRGVDGVTQPAWSNWYNCACSNIVQTFKGGVNGYVPLPHLLMPRTPSTVVLQTPQDSLHTAVGSSAPVTPTSTQGPQRSMDSCLRTAITRQWF